jgi:hypothetical protein
MPFLFSGQDAVGFALLFVGADPAADRGKVAALADNFVGGTQVTVTQGADKLGNIIFDRAAGTAAGFSTIQAAPGFFQGVCHAHNLAHNFTCLSLITQTLCYFYRLVKWGLKFSRTGLNYTGLII